ncbi:MAG: flagellar basal body P-ring protein FlgI [Pseudochelatococcus sp.]|jgi:flagellar P-ring protein precursor FlgI|uniref:flagellar basal body P-ring protein FlgI n=1 Tax=Pseudochelatococcus sp. TaxID=2020869 RepID=UPI003D9377E8
MMRLVLATLLVFHAGLALANTRIKDIVTLQGVRDNQLVGYGLVIGLQGTGDSLRNSPFTEQALQSMLERMGINVRNSTLRTRNTAAVMVTADIPAFSGTGTRIDVTVSSLGDAQSLKGGTLLVTPLMGGDGFNYAVAQGPIAVSGYTITGQAESVTQGVPTAGRIPNGALIERQLPGSFSDIGQLILELRNPDFNTAARIADAVNRYTRQYYKTSTAFVRDQRSVVVQRPGKLNSARFMAAIGNLPVTPDTPARVVVDQRTGTVVIGRDVRISTVALTHGNLTVRVTETPQVVQPAPFSDGITAVEPRTQISMEEQSGALAIVSGTSLESLVRGLNQIGLKPTDIISILQTIKTAGALQADLIVQ